MAELTRKEFAAMCGCDVKIINTNVSRKKVLVGYNVLNIPLENPKKIDSEHPTNKLFLDARLKINSKRTLNPIVSHFEKEKPKEKPKEKLKGRNHSRDVLKTENAKAKAELEFQKRQTELAELEIRKKKADTELQERKAAIEQVKLDKLAGSLLPLELHDSILSNYTRSIFTKFHSSLDNLASVYTDILAAGDRSKLSEISGKMAETLDEIINSAEEVAKLGTEKAISKYSEVRSRGEKK